MVERLFITHIETLQTTFRELELLTAGKTFAEYRADRMLRRAAERECDLVGHALSQLLPNFSAESELAIRAKQLSAFRDYLIHQYDEVEDAKVWEMATVTIPLVKKQVDAWLDAQHP